MQTITTTNTTCNCGCGQVLTGKKSRFAQGHDARFVSSMRTIALEGEKGLHTEVKHEDRSTDPATQSMISVQEAVERLGSPALREKLISGFRKERSRQEDRTKRDAAKAIAKENAKGRRTSAKVEKAAKAAAEVGDEASPVAIDLDSLAEAPAPEATVEGEKPVNHKNGGRTRRGNLGSQG